MKEINVLVSVQVYCLTSQVRPKRTLQVKPDEKTIPQQNTIIQKDVFMPATKAPRPSFGGLPMAPAIVEMRITWTMAEKIDFQATPPRFTQKKRFDKP